MHISGRNIADGNISFREEDRIVFYSSAGCLRGDILFIPVLHLLSARYVIFCFIAPVFNIQFAMRNVQ